MSEDQPCPGCGRLVGAEEVAIVDEASHRRSHVGCWGRAVLWVEGPLPPPDGSDVNGQAAGASRASRRPPRSPRGRGTTSDADLLIVALKRAGERARYVTLEADDELARMIERVANRAEVSAAQGGRHAPPARRAAS
jgi:hypothetical protein